MTPAESSVAVELARLLGTVETGFAEMKGQLAVIVERSTRTERDVEQLREDTGQEISELRAEVEALKRRQWPPAAVGMLTGVAGAATGALSLLTR
ncbi:MAG TPA: hypothetical protein VIU15_38535 [Streptomyces sp.]